MSRLNAEEVHQVEAIAELEVRRYFDVYLRDVLPVHVEDLRNHTTNTIASHDTDPDSHGGLPRRVERFFWIVFGATLVGGAGVGWAGSLVLKAAGIPLP